MSESRSLLIPATGALPSDGALQEAGRNIRAVPAGIGANSNFGCRVVVTTPDQSRILSCEVSVIELWRHDSDLVVGIHKIGIMCHMINSRPRVGDSPIR